MSEQRSQFSPANGRPSRAAQLLVLLVLLVGVEAVVLWGAVAWLAVGLATSTPDSLRSAIALTVLSAVLALWVSATAVGLARRSRWARSSAITWQVLQCAVAVGAVQGSHANPLIALALFVPATAVFGLAVVKPVRQAFGLDEQD